ncbi:hypothetical protein KQX54_018746 [Cotesia glomerata]|uniref:Uncharacterized protein n=1 Tax=Cotesia glomerata TaxID=32391 RepID=A0AAV7IF39_COTGL|nr:hypothetical protein KQX54_018746 [Cotesia glomerata]
MNDYYDCNVFKGEYVLLQQVYDGLPSVVKLQLLSSTSTSSWSSQVAERSQTLLDLVLKLPTPGVKCPD